MTIDRLIDRIDELGSPSVVGLDPSLPMMPDALVREMFDAYGHTPRAVSEMFLLYNKAIIDAVHDVVPAVKPQIAMYERYGLDGLEAYIRTCEYASGKGLYVIGDIKRGDISSTAEAYASHLSGAEVGGRAERMDIWHEDAITVNPYFGTDGIEPFTRACREAGKAIFVLVKTSNESSAELQDVRVFAEPGERDGGLRGTCGRGAAEGTSAESGIKEGDRELLAPRCGAAEETSAESGAKEGVQEPPASRCSTAPGMKMYERVADLVEVWGEGLAGERGYSAVGAVVGATHPEVGRALRKAHPEMFFLVPGYGAQGARAQDLAGFFDAEGRGCVVNSSRGVIAAWQRSAGASEEAEAAPNSARALSPVARTARAAALAMAAELYEASHLRW